MSEVFHERLKAPIPTAELERRSAIMKEKLQENNLDCMLVQNITQYMGGANRWLTDTTAENQYPQSSFITKNGEIGYIACSGPPLDLYPPSHLIRIGKPWDTSPYFSVFNYTWDWEGKLFGRWIEENNAKRIGISSYSTMQWNYLDYLRANYPDVEFVDVSDSFDALRAVKSDAEKKVLHDSAAMLDKVMTYLPSLVQPGKYEYEVRNKAMQLVTDLGGEEMVIAIGGGKPGSKFQLYPSYFQNRLIEKGDEVFVRLECSGPGGMFTTLGRMISVAAPPADQLVNRWQKAVDAQEKMASLLVDGAVPEEVLKSYNAYLKENGFDEVDGVFAHGQGYDYIERPSIQTGETMALAKDMCMSVKTDLIAKDSATYAAESYFVDASKAVRLSRLSQYVIKS